MFRALILAGSLALLPAFSGATATSPPCACCTDCACVNCACDELGCACDQGGECFCDASCRATAKCCANCCSEQK